MPEIQQEKISPFYQKEPRKNRLAEIFDALGFDVTRLYMTTEWSQRTGIAQRRLSFILKNEGAPLSVLEENNIRLWLVHELKVPEDTPLYE